MHTTSQRSNIKKHVVGIGRRLSRPVDSIREDIHEILEKNNMAAPRSNSTKNEAEIISDLPINQLHATFPVVLGGDRLVTSQCPVTKVRGQGQRRGSTSESLDSDLRSMRRNSLEGRRFQKAVDVLDKQSSVGVHELRQKVKEVFKDYSKLLQRSPTADQWLLMKKSRKSTLQERERENIARRYSRRERQFRAPPDLLDEVSKIRSHAMMEAGLKHADDENDDKAEKDLVTTMEAVNLSRRHTLPGDVLDVTLPQVNTMQAQKSGAPYGRRMTLADTRILQGVLDLKAERMLKLYMNGLLNGRAEVSNLDQRRPSIDCTNTRTTEHVTITEIK